MEQEKVKLKNINLKIARVRKGLSQQELSEKTNVSKQYISLLETGQAKNPSLSIMKKIAEVLEVSIGEIF